MAQAGVTTPWPPLARGGKVMPVATRFCHIHARGNGGRGTRHHPPWPPLSKGGKGYAALLRLFPGGNGGRGTRHHPPCAPPYKGGKGNGRHPIARNKNTRFAINSPIQSIPTFHHATPRPGPASRGRSSPRGRSSRLAASPTPAAWLPSWRWW